MLIAARLFNANTCLLTILIILVFCDPSISAEIRVPSNFSNIRSAIAGAQDGDVIIVSAGTYVENIDFMGKAIEIRSESGSEATHIDGGKAGPVVVFRTGEDERSVIKGFTLKRGQSVTDGGGVLIDGASPQVLMNKISENAACLGGAGISIRSGSPLIHGNTIVNNSRSQECSGGNGGGIRISGQGHAVVSGNTISQNSFADGGGLSLNDAGQVLVINNKFIGNSAPFGQGGGAWVINDSAPTFQQNLFVGNQAQTGGGIWWLVRSGVLGPQLNGNTFADNLSGVGSEIYADGFDGQVTIENSIFYSSSGSQGAIYCGNASNQNPTFRFNVLFSQIDAIWGGDCSAGEAAGNVYGDPLFLNRESGDYSLTGSSPAIDVGDGDATGTPDEDLDGNARILDGNGDGVARIDVGAFEFLPGPGIIQFGDVSYSALEDSGQAIINIVRRGSGNGQVSVAYSTISGTASAGIDFENINGSVSFENGEVGAKSISIPIINDSVSETDETFYINLNLTTGGALLGNPVQTTITIKEPRRGEFKFSSPEYDVGEQGGFAEIKIIRAGGSDGVVSVDFSTSAGSAAPGADYTETHQTVTFANGDSADKTVMVLILTDTVMEGNETVSLNLDNPSGGSTVGNPSTSVVNIADADVSTVQFTGDIFSAREDSESLRFVVSRTGSSHGAVEVKYVIADGNAINGTDYTGTTGIVTFQDGDLVSKTITITIREDAIVEGEENFFVTLSEPANALLGTIQTATGKIVDYEPGKIQFTAANYVGLEFAGEARITISRTNGSDGAVSVEFTTANRTAIANLDYVPVSRTIEFADKDGVSKVVVIPIYRDQVQEGEETIGLIIGNPKGSALLGDVASATLKISERITGYLGFVSPVVTVDENAGTTLLTVARQGGNEGELKIGFTLAAGTAVGGSDYFAEGGEVVYADGEEGVKGIAVRLINDAIMENEESFTVKLSSLSGDAVLTRDTVEVRVIDNDGVSGGNTKLRDGGCFIDMLHRESTTLKQQ